MPFLLLLRATETLVFCFCGCKRPELGSARVFPMVFGGKTVEKDSCATWYWSFETADHSYKRFSGAQYK
jgi:hypothetical protein